MNIVEVSRRKFLQGSVSLYYLGRRGVWSQNDSLFRRVTVLINTLAGSINRKGGIIFSKPIKLNQEEIMEPLYNAAQGILYPLP